MIMIIIVIIMIIVRVKTTVYCGMPILSLYLEIYNDHETAFNIFVTLLSFGI